jgi:cytochrome o ubiquinol oxidase subunit 3
MNEATMKIASTSKGQDTVKALGFWIYLMTDCVLFAALFATYVVLRDNTYGGPAGRDLFDMPMVLIETLFLLTSSFVCGLATVAARLGRKQMTIGLLTAVFLLGAAFLAVELREFYHLAAEGHGWQTSAFLSAFFTLVGTHGAHIFVGLLWLGVMGAQVVRRGFTTGVLRRLGLFAMFWHFLDIIWIFIFTVVYLMGVIS